MYIMCITLVCFIMDLLSPCLSPLVWIVTGLNTVVHIYPWLFIYLFIYWSVQVVFRCSIIKYVKCKAAFLVVLFWAKSVELKLRKKKFIFKWKDETSRNSFLYQKFYILRNFSKWSGKFKFYLIPKQFIIWKGW